MKRLLLATFFAIFFSFVSIRVSYAAFGGSFQGAFLSAFRNAQTLVQGVRSKVTRFLGIYNETPPASLPSLHVLSFSEGSEFIIGTEREIRWTYENLKESVTKITLLPEDKPKTLLMFLPAKRNVAGSDTYSFPVRFLPGTYRLQVCNGDACDLTNPFSIVFATAEERGRYVRGAEEPALFFEYWVQYTSPDALSFASSTDWLMEEYGDKIQVLVKQMPSDSRPGSFSYVSSLAALCAAKENLDAFWIAHEILLSEHGFSKETFYPAMSGNLSLGQFETCLQGGDGLRILESFMREAERKRVHAPGAFLRTHAGDGVFLPEASSFEDIRATAERLLGILPSEGSTSPTSSAPFATSTSL